MYEPNVLEDITFVSHYEMSHFKQNICHLLNFDGWLRLKDKFVKEVRETW